VCLHLLESPRCGARRRHRHGESALDDRLTAVARKRKGLPRRRPFLDRATGFVRIRLRAKAAAVGGARLARCPARP
jgi:hypothetical protein